MYMVQCYKGEVTTVRIVIEKNILNPLKER